MSSLRLSVYTDSTFNANQALGDLNEVPQASKDYILSQVKWIRAEEVIPNFRQYFLKQIDPKCIRGNPDIPDYTFWKVIKHLASSPDLVRS